MSLLFEYRTVFRTVAARQVPFGYSSSPVICWVDVVLARISALVDHPDCVFPHLPSLQKQREDDTLRAATQLPGLQSLFRGNLALCDSYTASWLEAAGWFASEDGSPAACRMSLRLTFVVYVLCATGSRTPGLLEEERYIRLISLDQEGFSRPPSLILQSALDAYIQRSPSPSQEDSGEVPPLSRTQGRLTDAMVLALLGVFKSIYFNTSFLTLFTGRRDRHKPAISSTQGCNPLETRTKRFSPPVIHIRDLPYPPVNAARCAPTDLGIF